MAARRRTAAATAPVAGAVVVPDWLRAGVVVETWRRPDDDSETSCVRRFRLARAAWLAEQGLSPWERLPGLESNRRRAWPWSFAQARADGTLPEILARLGLPADWTPVPREGRSDG